MVLRPRRHHEPEAETSCGFHRGGDPLGGVGQIVDAAAGVVVLDGGADHAGRRGAFDGKGGAGIPE